MTVAVLVSFDPRLQTKIIRVVWIDGECAGPWKTWEGILCLLIKAVSLPVQWLNESWTVVGTVPGDEGILVSVRIDPTIKGRAIVIGVPPKPMEMNYVVAVQLGTLLMRALAFPDSAYVEEMLIGKLQIHGPEAVHHAAEDLCTPLAPIGTPLTPTSAT